MSCFKYPLTDKFKDYLKSSSLEIYCHETWGQKHPDYRKDIRAFIAKHLGQTDDSVVFNLKNPLTKIDDTYISISHAQDQGVIALSDKPIGIDIESCQRVTEPLILRVSTKEEVQQCPHPSALWAAKESVYKCLVHFKQPLTVSQFEISDWQQLEKTLWSFQLKNPNLWGLSSGKGLLKQDENASFALFFSNY